MSPSCKVHPQRPWVVPGASLLGFVLGLGSTSFLSGCGDDNSQMVQVENAPAPAEKAKDSMNF